MNASYAVVGMKAGGREHIVTHIAEGDPVLLVPQPDNEYDPNAVAVYTAPSGALTDSQWQPSGWEIGPSDRRLLMDRQAGYLPRNVAARVALPPGGAVGTVHTVRFHPDTGAPAGFDVLADLPRR